jgi:hypothetical protein
MSSWWRLGTRAALSGTLALALAGCLGDTPAPSSSPTRAPFATPVMTTYQLETTVWVEGLIVTVHSATASMDAKGGPVTVALGIVNPGQDTAALDAPIRLTASGHVYGVVNGTVLPEVAAGGSTEVSLVFEVDGRPTIDDGVLRIGRSTDHQAQVPFTSGPVATLTLEPQDAALNTAVTAGGIRVVLHHRQTRWDLPDWHQELGLASEALILTYDATYVGTFSGGLAFTADNVSLRLPDGTLVAPRHDGQSQSLVLIGPKKTAKGLFSRFEIPAGATGTFGFIVMDGSIHRAVTFKVGP